MQNWLLSVFQGCCLKTMFVLRMVWYGLSDLHPFFPAFFQLLIWGEADGDKPATEPTEEDFEEGSAYFDQWCLHYCAPTQKEHIPDFKMFQWKRVWMYLSILFDPRGCAQAPHAWMGSHRQCWVSPKASGVCVECLHGQWRTFLKVLLTDLMLHCCGVITGKLDNIHKQQ